MATIGILALQGDFSAHAAAFGELGRAVVEVRRTNQLRNLQGLVVPGGESTALLNLMRDEPWFEELRRFHRAGGAFLGTCAGAILLAREVVEPAQPSLGLLDVVVRRNGFGRQVDSFEARIDLAGSAEPLEALFIRAPRFRHLGPGVETLARLGGEPVLVRQGGVMAGTFHPELTSDRRLHRLFLEIVSEQRTTDEPRRPRPAETPPGRGAGVRRASC